MENFNNYNFANITKEDVNQITELEKMISSKINKDIVLIAYEHKEDASKE